MLVAPVHRCTSRCAVAAMLVCPAASRRRQKDEETRLTWYLKDEVMRRGRVYYGKLAGGRSMFVAPRLISHFAAIWMPRRKDETYWVGVRPDAILRFSKN